MAQLNEGPLQLPEDPIDGFLQWLDDAKRANYPEPTAMTLATADRTGNPSARIVLFKGISSSSDGHRGLEFYTNYTSPKSKELEENPRAALVFHWVTMQRQIRIQGRVEKLTHEESDVYFQSRPRGSRIGAWSSPQSQKIGTREELEKLVHVTEERFGEGEIPCPPFWGGWRLVPERIEFWEGREYRLHERRLFERNNSGWIVSRLAP